MYKGYLLLLISWTTQFAFLGWVIKPLLARFFTNWNLSLADETVKTYLKANRGYRWSLSLLLAFLPATIVISIWSLIETENIFLCFIEIPEVAVFSLGPFVVFSAYVINKSLKIRSFNFISQSPHQHFYWVKLCLVLLVCAFLLAIIQFGILMIWFRFDPIRMI
jgi:hypothetical protein